MCHYAAFGVRWRTCFQCDHNWTEGDSPPSYPALGAGLVTAQGFLADAGGANELICKLEAMWCYFLMLSTTIIFAYPSIRNFPLPLSPVSTPSLPPLLPSLRPSA